MGAGEERITMKRKIGIIELKGLCKWATNDAAVAVGATYTNENDRGKKP